MLKQTVNYVNFNGVEEAETLYFNLSQTEIINWLAETDNNLVNQLENARANGSMKSAFEFLNAIIDRSYGEKSADGRNFRKSPEILSEFKSSAVYDTFVMDVLGNEGANFAGFVNAVLPAGLVDDAQKKIQRDAEEARIEAERNTIAQGYMPSARDTFNTQQNQATAGMYDVNSTHPAQPLTRSEARQLFNEQ